MKKLLMISTTILLGIITFSLSSDEINDLKYFMFSKKDKNYRWEINNIINYINKTEHKDIKRNDINIKVIQVNIVPFQGKVTLFAIQEKTSPYEFYLISDTDGKVNKLKEFNTSKVNQGIRLDNIISNPIFVELNIQQETNN